jgi:hypothetical protein
MHTVLVNYREILFILALRVGSQYESFFEFCDRS